MHFWPLLATSSLASFVQCLIVPPPTISPISSRTLSVSDNRPLGPASAHTPALGFLLTPQYTGGNLTSLRVTLSFQPPPETKPGDHLLYGTYDVVETQGLTIEQGSLTAFDAEGQLFLTSRRDELSYISAEHWSADRYTNGAVKVSYVALPRHVDRLTRSGPALDFRLEAGGFTSSGYAALMVPAGLDTEYAVSFGWDLRHAPPGTKGVWAFGEHHTTVTRTMTSLDVLQTYLGAGPFKAYRDEIPGDEKNGYNFYWLEDPPFSIGQICDSLSALFARMSVFFEDDCTDYRVFMRHNPYAGTNTGTALDRSFVFGYDESDRIENSPPHEKTGLVAHEMVHNWILFDGNTYPVIDSWYPEGMAEYYSLLFMFQMHIITAETYVQEINRRLISYYTNPFARMSVGEVARHTWEATSAQRIPYRRGFALAIILDDLIYTATTGVHSLDSVILELIRSKKERKPTGPQQFIASLGRLLDDVELAAQLYEGVINGSKLLVPSAQTLRHGRFKLPVTLCRRDREIFELGFSEQAARSDDRIIKDLVPGSRAEEAGLINGLRVLEQFQVAKPELDFDRTLAVSVRDPNTHEARNIEFWPRSHDIGESWQYVWDEQSEL